MTKRYVSIIMLGTFLVLSSLHVARVTLQESDIQVGGRRIVRVAHSMSEPRTQAAFRELADEYEELHPGVRIRIQTIPPRAYEQWVTTQLMGEMAPDLVQILETSGHWANLAQTHMQSLTHHINQPNPYNKGTTLEAHPWRETFIDGMDGGYFLHLMDFYGVPLTLETTRLFYNRDLFLEATGSDQPPENFSEWMDICDQLHTYRDQRRRDEPRYHMFPIAGSADDDYIPHYFNPLTAGMMDKYDIGLWGLPNPMATLYGLHTETFTLRHPRIRLGFEALRDIASHFQPGFMNDQVEQRRMLFVQERAAMVLGNTQDLGYYQEICNFRVGVFNFPRIDASHPRYGEAYEGPPRERVAGTFSFGLTRTSRNADIALDFLRFTTARDRNAEFCSALDWFPAIKGAPLLNPDLEVFAPQEEGVGRYPVFYITGSTQLYVEQNLPLYLDGQMTFDSFMTGLENEWITEVPAEVDRLIRIWIRNQEQTEFNVSRSKARMLFAEAGPVEAELFPGGGTPYQMGLEIIELLDTGNVSRRFIWDALQRGDYTFPPPHHPSAIP